MSTPVLVPGLFESWPFLTRRLQYGVVALVTLGAASALIWPSLTKRLFASNFLPHSFCYLGSQGLTWTHVLADFLIFLAYFAISATLVYLVYKGHREIPFHWMFLAFGLFIVACGATHLMEAITMWFPVYVLSGGVKIFTALASLTTAIILPFTVSQIFSLVKAARASEVANDRLRLAMESGKSVGWDWDVKSGRDLWFGDLQTMFGIPSNTYSGHVEDFRRRIYPQDRGLVWKAVNDARMTKSSYSAEFRVLHAEGTLRWVAAKGTFYYLPNGEAMRMLGMAFDVTELKRTQEALRESEERLRLAVQAGRMYAYEWDAATDMVTRSEECLNILGLSSSETQLTREQLSTKVHPDDRALFINVVDQVTPENPTSKISYRVMRSDGSVVWVERNARAFFDEQGRLQRMVGMVADITERKRAEEALAGVSARLITAQEHERTRIARELHDDIVQRLALLANELQQFREDSPNLPEVRKRVGELEKQTCEIASDIQSLSHELHSSKLEYLGMVPAMRSFCNEFTKQQKLEINFKNHDLPSTLPPDVSLCFFRVLQEALHNSAKYSGAKHIDVEFWATPNEVYLTVSDSGEGFDLKAAREGLGLGLISMEERLKVVGGDLLIESQPKHGTTIQARVPLRLENKAMHAAG